MADPRPATPPDPAADANSTAAEPPSDAAAALEPAMTAPQAEPPAPPTTPPAEPEPTDATEPTTGATDPTESVESVESVEPAQATEPTDVTELTDVTEPTEAPVEPTVATEPRAVTRRPRTAVLLLAAALLGPLLGAGIGYAVQAARPETPLPDLLAAKPHYPTAPATPAADAAIKPLAIDGDLRTLLIPRPDGTQEWDFFGYGNTSGWLPVSAQARSVGNSARAFTELVHEGVRRDAFVGWKKGDAKYLVELLQFDADHVASAGREAQDFSIENRQSLPGTANGFVATPSKQYKYAQSTETYYYGHAAARRGSVVMRISVFAPSQVNADELKDIAKRQWERLA